MKAQQIPPKRSGCARYTGLTDKLRSLAVGEGVELPRVWEPAVYEPAKRLGIKVTCRRLGSADKTTVYRTE